MLIASTTDATNINDEFVGVDGVFDVPVDVAQHLLQFPGWRDANEDEVLAFAKAGKGTTKAPAPSSDDAAAEKKAASEAKRQATIAAKAAAAK